MSRYRSPVVHNSYIRQAGLPQLENTYFMTAMAASETDVIFHATEHGDLTATVYRPAGRTLSAVVDVHGGAWTSGDRTMNAAIARHLAANGIAVLALDFRMPPQATYPATVTDIAAGVRWLKAHASEFGIDESRVGILGSSSGGHLALLTALRPSDIRYSGAAQPGAPDSTVSFAVLCWPVSDPAARYRMVSERANAKLVAAHNAFWADEAAMVEGSPLDIVTRGDAERLPPLLIVQGTNDTNLTPDMQDRFAAAYRERGGTVALETYDGEAHSFIGSTPDSTASVGALERITAFILAQADRA